LGALLQEQRMFCVRMDGGSEDSIAQGERSKGAFFCGS
jgi:hypothetical protein